MNHTKPLDDMVQLGVNRGADRYFFLFDSHPGNRELTIEKAARWMANEELSFTLGDAKAIIEQIEMTYL